MLPPKHYLVFPETRDFNPGVVHSTMDAYIINEKKVGNY